MDGEGKKAVGLEEIEGEGGWVAVVLSFWEESTRGWGEVVLFSFVEVGTRVGKVSPSLEGREVEG